MINVFLRILAITTFLVCIPSYALDVLSSKGELIVSTKKIIKIDGFINDATYKKFEEQYYSQLRHSGDILIILDSPGGEVGVGNKIIRLVEVIKYSNKVFCVANKDASSMAFNILSHCDVRMATNKTRMVVHKAAHSPVCDDSVRYTPKYLRVIAKELEIDDIPFSKLNAKLMKLTEESYSFFADEETSWSVYTLVSSGYLKDIVTLVDKE